MAYRSDLEALERRTSELSRELDEVKARLSAYERDEPGLRRAERTLDAELAETRRMLESLRPGNQLGRLLAQVSIAAPCTADWATMRGDERTRFCGQCQKNVYNLSAMTTAEAEGLIREKEGNLCARMFRRADGTILTTDCPVGKRRRRLRRITVGIAAGGLAAFAMVGASVMIMGKVRRVDRRVTTGAVVVDPTTIEAQPPPTGHVHHPIEMGVVAAPEPLTGQIVVPLPAKPRAK